MPGYQCKPCGAQFQRSAHLSRHRLLHLGERPFACSSCDRTFARRRVGHSENLATTDAAQSDTLQRHQTVHDRSRGRDREEALGRRVKHACRKCSQSKQRCDGIVPCNRCVQKNVACSYRGSELPEESAEERHAMIPPAVEVTAALPPRSRRGRGPTLDPGSESESCTMPMNQAAPYELSSFWPAGNHDQPRDAALIPTSASAVPIPPPPRPPAESMPGPETVALPGPRSTSERLDFAAAESSTLDPMPLTTDYAYNMSSSASSGPDLSHRATAAPLAEDEHALNNQTMEVAGLDIFGMGMNPQDMAYWDVSQYLDTLHQRLDATEMTYEMPLDIAATAGCVPIETAVSAPDLGPNVASPPAPSFLDARASPEPHEGQELRFDEYVREVFANRRHLNTNKDVHAAGTVSSRGRELEKAHLPPLIGDIPPILSSSADESIWESESLEHVPYLPVRVYEQIMAAFQNLNITRGPWIEFAGGNFPSLAACNAFMQLYFEEFNPLFPFLHQPTFDPARMPWLLVLAIISIGIRFAREPAAIDCGDIMQEFLRRAFLATIEADYGSTYEPWLAQAGLLNQIGMAFSKDMRLMQSAQSIRSQLSSICRQINCFQENRRPVPFEKSVDEAWEIWLRRESMCRLAYTLWLVDSQYLLYFDLPPLIPTNLLRVRLPYAEALWSAPTASSWMECYQQNGTYLPLTIREELNCLYRSRVRHSGLGDFAILLLIVGVFRNAIEVRRALEDGTHLMPYLSHSALVLRPPALGQPTSEASPTETFPITCKAMEYLRILCPPQDEVPRLSSLKSAIVHHYHAIGVLLGISLGELFCWSGYRVTSTDIAHCEARLKVWAQQHGEEVRQVALHASRLFAYIRRSNLHHYYEGRFMLIACQALWIYAATTESLTDGTQESAPSASLGNSGSVRGRQSIIRLDQVLTREAAEAWIREGDQMRPCLAGVGSLQGREGVLRLVQEGSRVMSAATIWPFNIAQGKGLRVCHQLRSGLWNKEVG